MEAGSFTQLSGPPWSINTRETVLLINHLAQYRWRPRYRDTSRCHYHTYHCSSLKSRTYRGWLFFCSLSVDEPRPVFKSSNEMGCWWWQSWLTWQRMERPHLFALLSAEGLSGWTLGIHLREWNVAEVPPLPRYLSHRHGAVTYKKHELQCELLLHVRSSGRAHSTKVKGMRYSRPTIYFWWRNMVWKYTAPNLIQHTYIFLWATFFTVQNKYIRLVINLNDCTTQTMLKRTGEANSGNHYFLCLRWQ